MLNLNQHLKKNFLSTAFLKNLLQNWCLILQFTIWGTFPLAIILPAKPPNSCMQQVPHFYPIVSMAQYLYVYPTICVCVHPKGSRTTRDSSFRISNFLSLLSEFVKLPQYAVWSTQSLSKSEGLTSHWRWWVFQCAGDILVPLHYHCTPYLVTITQLLKGNNTFFVDMTLLLEWFS